MSHLLDSFPLRDWLNVLALAGLFIVMLPLIATSLMTRKSEGQIQDVRKKLALARVDQALLRAKTGRKV